MRRLFQSRRPYVGAAVVLTFMCALSYGALTWNNGQVTSPVSSPGAAAFTTRVFINITPVSLGGFGDTIWAIEEGRDDVGPYTAIVWSPGPGSPHFAPGGPHPCYPHQYLVGGIMPSLNNPPQGDNPGSEAVGLDCSYSAQVPFGTFYRFMYRPSNDPAHRGWTVPPGTTSADVTVAQLACRAVGETLREYVFNAGTGGGVGLFGPGTLPMIELEVAVSGVPFHEFYKFRIMTI